MTDDGTVHPDDGQIHAWLDGALGAASSAVVEAHVISCADCTMRVAEARGLIAGASRVVRMLDETPAPSLRSVAVRAPEPSLWRAMRVTPARASIAAALVVAVGITLTREHVATESPLAPRDSAVVAVAPQAVAAPAPASRPDSVLNSAVVKKLAKEAPPRSVEAAAGVAIPTPPPSTAATSPELNMAPARRVAAARDSARLSEVVVTSAPADKVSARVPMAVAPGAGCYRIETADGSKPVWQGIALPLDVSLASAVASYAPPPPSAAADAVGEARYSILSLHAGTAVGQWSRGAGDTLSVTLRGATATAVGTLAPSDGILAGTLRDDGAKPSSVRVVARKISCSR
jgi:hypothetical protein